MIPEGAGLLDRAIAMRHCFGTEAAALWMEGRGLPFEIAVLALVGSERARRYGVHVGRVCSRDWNKDK